MADIPDVELVKRVAQRDEQAFLLLYDRYASRVYALILRILGDPQAAEEATQDAFLKCWSRAHRFLIDRGMFAPWLLTIARNTALDRLRLERRRPTLTSEADPEDLWELLPQEGSESEETRWRTLYFALQELPKDQRVVIEMAYYQGLSQSEIAEVLDRPIGTIKTWMRLGMAQLRDVWLDADKPSEKSDNRPANV